MSKPTISRLEFKPGFRQRTQCSYWDYYINDQRLADVFGIGDFIPPFGWLSPETELPFTEMLLRKRESNFRPKRIPLFVCPECVHHGCGVFTCLVIRNGQRIEWRDFAMQNDYEDEMRQNDAERWTHCSFDVSEYFHAFSRFIANGR